MAIINLYSVPECDMTYEHAPYFGSQGLQDTWFLNKRQYQIDGKVSVDPMRTSVTVDLSYGEIEGHAIDYCSLTNTRGKIMYYFVVDYDYITEGATTLILALDPLQTYMFDIKFKDSFVDRCHVPRWTSDGMPTKEVEPEGLDFGDNIPTETMEVKKLNKDNMLIVASRPLGIISRKNQNDGWLPTGMGGGSGQKGDCWKDGKVSADLFRLAKGFEGFGPYIYKDSGGVPTIGYGTTEHDKLAWKVLTSKQPCAEDVAAKLAYESFNKEYGKSIKDFVVREFKVDNQHKFDALADLAYNAGPGRVVAGDLADILKKYPNDESKVRPVWEKWIIRDEHGVIQDGLIARRAAECDMYFYGKYEKRDINVIGKDGRPTGELVKNGGWLPKDCSGESGGDIPDIDKLKAFHAYGHDFVYPLQGGGHRVNSKLGWRKHPISGQMKFHNGDDYGAKLDENVYATHSGKVIKADNTDIKGYGWWIILQNDDMGIQTYYAHNNSLLVKVGDTVKRGQVIAKAGSSGGSTGVHLHYELRNAPYLNADVVDPIPNLKDKDIF